MVNSPESSRELNHNPERLRRWRLVLGGETDGVSTGEGGQELGLSIEDKRMDDALAGLYDASTDSRRGGLGASAPKVARWPICASFSP